MSEQEESKSNLKLWGLVERTNAKHTKSAKKGQYQFTAITPMSQFKKATEVFGVQGLDWGVKVGSEVFTETTIGTTTLLNYDAVMYFKFEDREGELPIHSTEKLAYMTNGGNGYLKIDDEARKKVVTNAKTKGLSELGFNADVFMGQFENPEYLEERKAEAAMEEAEDKEKLSEERYNEVKEMFNNYVKTIEALPTALLVDNMRKKATTNVQRKLAAYKFNPALFNDKIKHAADKRIEEIRAKQEPEAK